MRHWLQAEQELARPSSNGASSSSTNASAPARNSDVTPLQGTRAGAAVSSTQSAKRTASSAPVAAEKNGNGASQNGARRKPTAAAL